MAASSPSGDRHKQRGAVAHERDARSRRSALLRHGPGIFGDICTPGPSFPNTLHPRIGFTVDSGSLYSREGPGNSRQADLQLRTHRERPYPETSGSCNGRVLDLANDKKTAPDSERNGLDPVTDSMAGATLQRSAPGDIFRLTVASVLDSVVNPTAKTSEQSRLY